jgi:hypothetical protein
MYSLRKKYDQVIRRNLAGIGIWALGYDDGYQELWDLLAEKFTASSPAVCADTIYDTGGPGFDYYNNENYTYTITSPENTHPHLSFSYLNVEEVYDLLWIYDGKDTNSPLIGAYSGDNIPLLIVGSGNAITLKFHSDIGITSKGWRAVYDTIPVSSTAETVFHETFKVYPNPSSCSVFISSPTVLNNPYGRNTWKLTIFNSTGQIVHETMNIVNEKTISIDTKDWESGVYCIHSSSKGKFIGSGKLIVK